MSSMIDSAPLAALPAGPDSDVSLYREVMRRAVVAPDQPAIIQAEALVQVCQRRQLFCF